MLQEGVRKLPALGFLVQIAAVHPAFCRGAAFFQVVVLVFNKM